MLQNAVMPALRWRAPWRQPLSCQSQLHALQAGPCGHLAKVPAVAEGAAPGHHQGHCPRLYTTPGGCGGSAAAACSYSNAALSQPPAGLSYAKPARPVQKGDCQPGNEPLPSKLRTKRTSVSNYCWDWQARHCQQRISCVPYCSMRVARSPYHG
ncbi:hypothetical protein HPB50_028339 [Hyalomma asiaticum]|nr:hypothetical protein HPB50_028339 [Hyalomma asiaticum]